MYLSIYIIVRKKQNKCYIPHAASGHKAKVNIWLRHSPIPHPLILANWCSFFFLIFGYMVCGILVPWPGIESMPHAVQVQSFNCWTTRKVPWCSSNSGGVTWTSTPGDPSPWQSYLYLFILIIGHHGSTRSYPQASPGSSSPLSSLIMQQHPYFHLIFRVNHL